MKKGHTKMTITKASGERNVFSAEKLRHSLLRSGASTQIVEDIMVHIPGGLYDGIPTSEIYSRAFTLLKQYKRGTAAKYKLKTAIMELGPTGFPFEQFVARIFESMGYATQTGQILQGKCVTHEVDVVAAKGIERNLIECKYHQQKGVCCDVKIPLYIAARFEDIRLQQHAMSPGVISQPFTGWLITNTHFSKDAIAYGLCAGLHVMGWDFPAKNGLRELIDKNGLHPLTSLTTLTKSEKQLLLEKKLVLCSDLEQHWELIGRMVHQGRLLKVREECRHLSETKNPHRPGSVSMPGP